MLPIIIGVEYFSKLLFFVEPVVFVLSDFSIAAIDRSATNASSATAMEPNTMRKNYLY